MANLCREKYVNGKLVSRLCIQGNLFMDADKFPRPDYELSEVSSCDLCPTYPTETDENDEHEEIKAMLKEILDIIKK